MLCIPIAPVGMDCSNIMTAEADANTKKTFVAIENKHRFRTMKTTIQSKCEKVITKLDQKLKNIATSKVHAEITKRHTTTTAELLATKAQLASKEVELKAEVTARECAERKQLKAQQQIEALTREVQVAKEENIAAGAARVRTEQDCTRSGEQLLALKREHREVIVGFEKSGERSEARLAESEKQREALKMETAEFKARCNNTEKTLDSTRQQLAESVKKCAEEESAKLRAIAQRNTAEYADEEAQQDLAAAQEKYEGLSSDYMKLKALYKRKMTEHQKSLATSEEKLRVMKKRYDALEDEKLDLEEEKGELKGKLYIEKDKSSKLETDLVTIHENVARAAREGIVERDRADDLQAVVDEMKLKTAGLEAQLFNKTQEVGMLELEGKQSISTLQHILPEETSVTAHASLGDLTKMVIEHHRYLLEKVKLTQAKLEDIKADFKARDVQARKAVSHANSKLYEASASMQQASAIQQQLEIAKQHAAKLPKLQADHDKHLDAANHWARKAKAKEVELEKWQRMVTNQNVHISQLKKDVAELKDKTSGEDSEQVKKLKGELEMAKYELHCAKVEVKQAKEAAAAAGSGEGESA